jgi:hypothetical protein
LSLSMNLADAITQASQDNNRKLATHTHPDADAIVKVHPRASQEAIEKSKLFLEMVQMSLPEGSRYRDSAPLGLDLPVQTPGTVHQQSPQDSDFVGHEEINSPVDLEPSITNEVVMMEPNEMLQTAGNPAQEVSVGIFPYQVILRTLKLQTLLLNTVTHDERLSGSETTAIKDVIESDDELEYIDEPENGTVVQGIASINIAEGNLEGIRDPEPFAEQPSSSTTNAISIINNGIVPTVAASLSRAYTPHLVSSSIDGFGIKIDGFTIINWLEFRKNFTPKYFLGRDLPHTLQDYINHMSEWTRSLPDMRTVFSAAIQENTALDEPDAPSIQIENAVDDEPTPPWEFHYSNYMWHGEGVPPPDVGSLISCDCIGRCDPRSGTCACALRQREAIGDPNADFAYDHRGRLREPGYPIFECNELCACDDDCRNRVSLFQSIDRRTELLISIAGGPTRSNLFDCYQEDRKQGLG